MSSEYVIRLIHEVAMPHMQHCGNKVCEYLGRNVRQKVWPVELQTPTWIATGLKDPIQFWCYQCVRNTQHVGDEGRMPNLSLSWPCRIQVVHYPHEARFTPCECLEHERTLKILPEREMPTTEVVTQYISTETGGLVQSVSEHWCRICVQRAQADDNRQYVIA